MTTNNTPIIVVEQQKQPIDFSNGIQAGELLLLAFLFYGIVSKVAPIVITGRKVYHSLIYINKDELKLQVELQKLLEQILAVSYGDRVIIGLFHNGTKDNLGFHLQKMSVYAEAHTDNLPPQKPQLQCIPVDYIREEILIADSEYYQTIKRGTLDSMCDKHMDDIGIIRKDSRTFRGVKREIYGIINIHYAQEPEGLWQDDLHRERQVNKITSRIQQILERIKNPGVPKWRRFIAGWIHQ